MNVTKCVFSLKNNEFNPNQTFLKRDMKIIVVETTERLKLSSSQQRTKKDIQCKPFLLYIFYFSNDYIDGCEFGCILNEYNALCQ